LNPAYLDYILTLGREGGGFFLSYPIIEYNCQRGLGMSGNLESYLLKP